MNYSVVRQAPVTALLTLAAVTAVAFVRFSLSPFNDEFITGAPAPLAIFVDRWQAAHPSWGIALSALIAILTGMTVGLMGAKFGLYPTQCIFSVPLYGLAACGIFISENSLSAAIASFFAASALRHLCGGYFRGQNLTAMLYAGLCTGAIPMFCGAGTIYVPATVIAMYLFALSVREIIVLSGGILFVPLTVCYVSWAFGGDFLAPLQRLADALIVPSGYTVWGSDAVAALVMIGTFAFAVFCSIALFPSNKYSIATKSRSILVYIIILCILSCAIFLLPSVDVAFFALAAIPAALVMPMIFLKAGDSAALMLYILIISAFAAHLFIG